MTVSRLRSVTHPGLLKAHGASLLRLFYTFFVSGDALRAPSTLPRRFPRQGGSPACEHPQPEPAQSMAQRRNERGDRHAMLPCVVRAVIGQTGGACQREGKHLSCRPISHPSDCEEPSAPFGLLTRRKEAIVPVVYRGGKVGARLLNDFDPFEVLSQRREHGSSWHRLSRG